MQTTTAAEREQFRNGIRSFLVEHSSEQQVRHLMEDPNGFDATVWSRLSEQLGVPGVLVPESSGGQDLSFVEMALVLEEAGRALLCAPVLSSSAVATTALTLAHHTPASERLLRELASGELIVTLAESDDPAPVTVRHESDGSPRLTGVTAPALDAQLAHVLLVTAENGGALELFAVSADDAGVNLVEVPVLDLTRKQAIAELQSVEATALDADFAGKLTRTRDIAAILASAEMLGCAQRALELAVEYAMTREQFGNKIGAFQSIKHLLADSLARVEQMRAAVAGGAQAATAGDDDLAEVASVVKAYCSQAGAEVVQTLIQVLGGIGFTWEHPAHLYLRRVRSTGMLYGTPAEHRRRLAQRLGLAAV